MWDRFVKLGYFRFVVEETSDGEDLAESAARGDLATAGVGPRTGTKFRAAEIPGLEPAAADGVVAEVTSNPKDPSMLGITNRSRAAWQATTADGKAHPIETDKTVRVADGIKLRFGRTDGAIQR